MQLRTFLGGKTSQRLLFVNTSGRALDTTAFRPGTSSSGTAAGHRLAGSIIAHSLRRAGMSMWLREGVDPKLIQAWGGWHSLKVTLDTYAALLPSDEEDSTAPLEGGRGSPAPAAKGAALLAMRRCAVRVPQTFGRHVCRSLTRKRGRTVGDLSSVLAAFTAARQDGSHC